MVLFYVQQKKAKDENFMANNEIKTNAEIYREQRKARLAKAAKKRKSGKGDKIVRVLIKVICIILAVGIVLFGVGKMLTDVFGVPQRLLPAATYNGEKISAAEYNYYYMVIYNQAAAVSQQYDQQYSGAGASYFDLSKSPADQEYPGDDALEDIKTWADYFKYMAPQRAFLVKELYAEAMSDESEFKLTDEQKTEMQASIDEAMDEIAESAKSNDYAVDNFIAKTYGSGLNEKLYRELAERDTVAQYYLEWLQENYASKISDDDVLKYYNEHRADVDVASFRYFTVSYAKAAEGSTDPEYTKDEAKARAEAFKAEATTEEGFIAASKKYAPPSYKTAYAADSATLAPDLKKANIATLSEEFANWTFDASRKAGEMNIFEVADQQAFYIVLITEPAHKDTTTAGADVRHLLVQAETTKEDAEGASVTLSDAEIKANFEKAKAEAEKLLKEWKDNGATEEKFIELVKEHTDDTASAETGGLYSDINSESNYVPEFLEWSLAPHKAGDTGIVKTDYGYHIMYMVESDSQQKWEGDIRTTLSTDDYNKYYEDLTKDLSDNIDRKDGIINWTVKNVEKLVENNVAYYSTSAGSYAY